jgi:hypothetical protein
MMKYCGRDFSAEEISWIKTTVVQQPGLNRNRLSKLFCKRYNWKKPDGGLKDMSCRVAMLKMDRDGLIKLPLTQRKRYGPRKREQWSLFTNRQAEITAGAGEFSLSFQIADKSNSSLWNEFIARYHYLGYTPLPGAQLRYFIQAGKEIIALLGFGASAWKTAPRDDFIGWAREQREQRLQLIVNNNRFLILPWVRSPNLASKILGAAARRLTADWQKRYRYLPVLLETFVEKGRFEGTCYKASNWIYVGDTKGRGKKDRYNKAPLPVKSVWLYPLSKNYKETLCS